MARRSGIRKWKQCTGQEPMFKPDSEWVAPNLNDLPSWQGISRIGLDTEGRDPTLKTLGPGVRRDGYTCGISFAIEDGPAYYLPTRHHGGGNLDPKHVEQYMKDQAAVFTGAICGANLQYDLDFLAERGIIFRHATFLDIQVAEPLIDENQLSYALETLALKYGFLGKEETLLQEAAKAYGWTGNDVKKNMWQLPAKFVGPYAAEDAVLPLKILRKQEKIIDDQDIWDIYKLECKVLPVLLKMRRRGIRIDFDQLEKVEALTRVKEQEYLDQIYHISGIRIKLDEINKTKLVIAALDVMQIPYGMTDPTEKFPEGQASVKKEFLEPNIDQPIVNAILEVRSYNKVRNTFVKSIREHQVKGRIHSTFNQLRTQQDNSDDVKGAGPGRLSNSAPNLQQQPSRHPVLGKMWRSIYLPDEGGRWASLDYSQQEPRLFIHYAHISGCAGTQDAIDGFHAGYDWHDMTTELAFGIKKADDPVLFDKMRKRAKAIFLGIVYGMGQAKMCHSCGFSTEFVNIRGAEREVAGPEGKRFLAEFNAKVPFLKEIKDMAEKVAWNRKYIRTILGRHIHYPPGAGNERKALNNLIQGCVRGDTYLVEKSRGHQQIKDLVGGVTLWDGSKWSKASVVPTGKKEEVKLTFKNGQTIFCSEDHRFLFVNTLGSEIWKQLKELKPGKRIRRSKEVPSLGTGLVLPPPEIKTHWKAPNGPANTHRYSFEDIKDSYQRGLLLGRIASDGNFSGHNVVLLIADHERNIAEQLFRNLPFRITKPRHRRSVTHYPISSVTLNRQCRYLDLKNKIHPYLFSNKELLRGYLRGYFDGDGGVSISKANKTIQKDYATIHLCFGRRHNHTTIASDMQKALTIFGISSRLKYYDSSVRLRIQNKYNSLFLKEIGFMNSHKNDKVQCNDFKNIAIGATETIVSIQKTGRIVDMYDVINSESGQFSLHGLVSHNSSADQMKLAMVLMDEQNIKIQLQIHDEIAITIYEEQTAKDAAQIMTDCVPLVVPSKVDIEIGNSWGDSMK